MRATVRSSVFCVSLMAAGLAPLSPARAGEVTVVLTGITHAGGQVKVGLWRGEEGWRDEGRAVALRAVPAAVGEVRFDMGDMPPGDYAVMAYHDEDGDGEMDRFLGMIPTEGYGLSNNPEVSGPPAFADAAFPVAEGPTEVVVPLNY